MRNIPASPTPKFAIITHMPKQSAGILLYRKAATGYEVLLVHPGGPFWVKKDKASWSIPKGEPNEGEAMLDAAKREFKEEVGTDAPDGDYAVFEPAKQPSGKVVHAFALESDFDISAFKSMTIDLEWPPKSGRMQQFPENDKVAWISLDDALEKVVKGQVPILGQLLSLLGVTAADTLASSDNPQTTLF